MTVAGADARMVESYVPSLGSSVSRKIVIARYVGRDVPDDGATQAQLPPRMHATPYSDF